MKKLIHYTPKTADRESKTLAALKAERKRVVLFGIEPTSSDSRGYVPVIKKWGNNRIELSPMTSIEPLVFNVSPDKVRVIGKSERFVAEILQKSHIASLRRLGEDILDE